MGDCEEKACRRTDVCSLKKSELTPGLREARSRLLTTTAATSDRVNWSLSFCQAGCFSDRPEKRFPSAASSYHWTSQPLSSQMRCMFDLCLAGDSGCCPILIKLRLMYPGEIDFGLFGMSFYCPLD